MRTRLVKILDSVGKDNEDLTRARKEQLKMKDKVAKSKRRYHTLNAEMNDLENRLRELRAYKRENERDFRLSETVKTLKQLFPGVHGRMVELYTTRHERYGLPVTVAMGRFIDAVVVEGEHTGKECIEYLIKQRLRPMTFIPLQSVRVKPVAERLRTLGGTAKLVFDVVDFDRAFEKAVLYAVGNTLVCDEISEAKRLGWSRQGLLKVVTIDGTLLTGSGTMTGGTSGGGVKKEEAFAGLK
ncbi:hypothetical protein ACP275_13G100800 [Erythranthe tilingii]